MFRFGLTTSPAVNVMLFQASQENSEPTIATPIAARMENPVSGSIVSPPPDCSRVQAALQKSEKFALIAKSFAPQAIATTIRPKSAAVFVRVKTSWISFPVLQAPQVQPGEQDDDADGQELRRA